MKRTGRHPYRELTDKWVLQAKIPGRFADGNGLYLVVDPSGAKRWVLRTVINGRRRDMGLGSYQLVSLKDAREQAVKYRNIARAGGLPSQRENELSLSRPLSRKLPALCILEGDGKTQNIGTSGLVA